MNYQHVSQDHWVVRLDPGDELHASLFKFAEENSLRGGQLTGIGGLREVELGVFDKTSKTYHTKTITDAGVIEVVSLSGNCTFKEGKPFWHLHIVVTDRSREVQAGHLMRGIVDITMEIIITVWDEQLERVAVPELGFWKINL
ncbi:MAG TPA: DNA-binding protein [bacterium]|nr:DNA-binding protein [bacterium]